MGGWKPLTRRSVALVAVAIAVVFVVTSVQIDTVVNTTRIDEGTSRPLATAEVTQMIFASTTGVAPADPTDVKVPTPPTTVAPPASTAAPLAPRSTTPTGAVQCKDLAARGTWTSDVTHPGLEVERWWAAKEGPNRAGHFNTTGLSGCQYTMLKSDEIRECLRGKKVVVMGDSIVRNVLTTLLMMIYPSAGELEVIKFHEDWSKIPDPGSGSEFHFLWRPYSRKFSVPKGLRNADVALYGVGLWDIASGNYSASPRLFHRNLLFALRRFERDAFAPKQRTFLTIHNVTREDHRVCYTGARVAAFRRAASCAVGDSRQPWSMLDYTDATSTALPAHWDRDWTHITGTLNEGLVHMWLNGICGFASGPFASECAGVSGAESEPWKTMSACDVEHPS